MARKELILKLHATLVLRRDALRKALAGDLSLLKSLPEQTGGDVVEVPWSESVKGNTACAMSAAGRFLKHGSPPYPTR